MISIWDATYIVTDVETTGSHTVKNRMTEIACVTLRGGDIISSYSTLMNPYQAIPPYVAKMTGISQSMVNEAPDEYELINTIKELFIADYPVFTAHNVNFDYGFVSSFFKRGYLQFDYPQLCTLKLARKLLPRDIKKNVGDLSAYFGIKLKNRHRALIDAKATAMILAELLYIAEREHQIKTLSELLQFQNKPVFNYKISNEIANKLKGQLNDVPTTPGIFKFLDSKNKVIYWDCSFNLRNKVHSFFDTHYITSKPLLEMASKISKIQCISSESELSALILRDKLNEISDLTDLNRNNIELFPKTHKNGIASKPIADFVYIQAQMNNEKVVDVYLIKAGKLVNQKSVGRRASMTELNTIIEEAYSNPVHTESTDYKELKVINKWIDMQNNSGLMIETTDKDINLLIEEINFTITTSFDMTEPAKEQEFYF